MASNKEIVALNDFEHVLLRPAIYIGSVQATEEKVFIAKHNKLVSENKEISIGFYKLMDEVLSNAFDEAKRMGGKMSKIMIFFNSKDNSVSVIDTGGGFLNGSSINKTTGMTNVASAMSMLRAGSNFKNDNTEESLIGTNGVGASVVNMLSDFFSVVTVNDKEVYIQEWNQFITKGPKVYARTKETTGTVVKFVPRKDIFGKCTWDKEYIHTQMLFREYMRKSDPLLKDLDFSCVFDGVKLNLEQKFMPDEMFKIETKIGTLCVWESYQGSASASFVNGALCTGIHQRIFTEWINDAFESQIANKFYETFIILNFPAKYVRFQDQNKTRYGMTRGEISPILTKFFDPYVKKHIKANPIYQKILAKIADAEREGEIKNLKNKKKAARHKISDKYFPSSGDTKNLYICEGGSAMGSILQKRNSKTDAVYALKGKIRNARKLSDLTSNAEIIDLMNILNLDPENDRACKFERIIISCDADPDGEGHIASLLINLFYKWFPNVVRQGRLFMLKTPLISGFKKHTHYFYSHKEFESYKDKDSLTNIRYFKGLGSLGIDDWIFIFNNLHLSKIQEDSKSEKMLEMAFGTNASLRKKWLQS